MYIPSSTIFSPFLTFQRIRLKKKMQTVFHLRFRQFSGIFEPIFVKVEGAQESSPAWVSIPGLLNRFTNTGSAKLSGGQEQS
jgi:hypothetical protein